MSVSKPEILPMGDSPQRAAAKETLWRLAALAVAHPAREFHETLLSGAYQDAFSGAWVEVTGAPWRSPPPLTDYAAFEAGFIAAFLHGPKGKPVAALLAGEHEHVLAGLTRPVFMLNLTAFYKHFGLQPAQADEGRQDEPDHLATMLEFMAVLCHLESGVLARGGDPGPPRRAQRDFLCRYLAPTLGAVAGRLRRDPVAALDPTLERLMQDMAHWAEAQIAELEARVGPFRDPDAPRPAGAAPEPATQNLWG